MEHFERSVTRCLYISFTMFTVSQLIALGIVTAIIVSRL